MQKFKSYTVLVIETALKPMRLRNTGVSSVKRVKKIHLLTANIGKKVCFVIYLKNTVLTFLVLDRLYCPTAVFWPACQPQRLALCSRN
jgi:hypothetical protein